MAMQRWVRGMRDAFFDALYALAKKDKKIILVTSDTGAICHDRFKAELKGQYLNVGIAEQNMIGIAAGLAQAGKRVFVYAIAPFATMRCYEQIRVDLCCMDLPVTVVGVGAGFDYSTLGPTHHATEDIALMRALPDMEIYSPSDSLMAGSIAGICSVSRHPQYVRIDRTGLPLVYTKCQDIDFARGFNVLCESSQCYIAATGRMVNTALKVSRRLSKNGVRVGVIDVFRLKPVNEKLLWRILGSVACVVSLEEHFVTGGLGTIISEIAVQKRSLLNLHCIGMPHAFCRQYGSREYLYALHKLDEISVSERISAWMKEEVL